MEGKYAGNHAICETAGRTLHYPDFDMLSKEPAVEVRRRRTGTGVSQSAQRLRCRHRKTIRLSKEAISFYRRRLIQLLLIAIVLTFIFGSIGVHADPIDTACNEEELTYKVITVEQGDTLWDIADTWFESTGDNIHTYISNIQDMNHLHGDHLQEGQLLMIYHGDLTQ